MYGIKNVIEKSRLKQRLGGVHEMDIWGKHILDRKQAGVKARWKGAWSTWEKQGNQRGHTEEREKTGKRELEK